jgi:hypothetical protein
MRSPSILRRALAASLVVSCVSFGCALITDLGDPPTIPSADAAPPPETGPADTNGSGLVCGIDVGSEPCAQCISTSCCSKARTCADDPGCSTYESCILQCGADFACRATCFNTTPPSSPAAADLDRCIASECGEGACGVECGISNVYSEPSVAQGCHDCLVSQVCSSAQSCFGDEGCAELNQCATTARRLDVLYACSNVGGPALPLYTSFLNASESAPECLAKCIGSNWECVGNVAPPLAEGGQVVANFDVKFFTQGGAIEGATVSACPAAELDGAMCKIPTASQTTDANGAATLSLSATGMFGFAGYFEITSPTTYPTLQFYEAGLQVPSLPITEELFTTAQITLAYGAASIAMESASHGTLLVAASDCHFTPAVNVTVAATNTDAMTVLTYPSGGTTLTATGSDGAAIFQNMPAGRTFLSMTRVGDTKPVAKGVGVWVRPATLTVVTLYPN